MRDRVDVPYFLAVCGIKEGADVLLSGLSSNQVSTVPGIWYLATITGPPDTMGEPFERSTVLGFQDRHA
jgi:hypothetical protein